MAAPNKLMYQTQCRFCGMQPPPQEPFVPMLNGEFDPRVIQFVQALQKHVEKKHPKEYAALISQVMRFTGFATVGAFDVQDPLLLQTQEQIRADLHRKTRKAFLTDEHITAKVSEIEEWQDDGTTVLELSRSELAALLRDMRDLLCEEGAYAPSSSTAEKTLVSL